MRILSLGFPLPGPANDNHTFAGAPSFFDYDALLVDPRALSQLIQEIVDAGAGHTTRSGERVVNGSSAPDAVSLADLLRARRDETARLLARGGLVICFAEPNAVHRDVAGFAGCDRYCWLPAPAGLRYDEPFLRRGAGTAIMPTHHDHPFGPFVDRFRGRLAYQAYFAEDTPGAAGLATVFARSAGGVALALELPVEQGRVVFLPPPARPPSSDERYAYAEAIQHAARETLRLAATSSAPPWTGDYDLPGLKERIDARDEAQRRRDEAHELFTAAQDAVDELAQYRSLLWQEGRYGFETAVRQALAVAGFRVTPADIDQPAQIAVGATAQAQTALLEVDAAEGAVGMDGHYRLRHRLEEAIEKGRPKRGVLIVNGHRMRPPAERPAQYREPLRIAAESLRYCVATGEQLFHAVRAALAGDDATVRAFRERLLSTDGVLRED